MGEESDKRYWVGFAVDNSIPRPKPDPDTGFLPMYFNVSPFVASTNEGDDVLCVFSTEGNVIWYLREEERQGITAPATAIPLTGADDFRQFLVRYPAVIYVAVDPEHGAPVENPVAVEEFLSWIEH